MNKSTTARISGLNTPSFLQCHCHCQRRWISPYRRLAHGSQAENDNAIEGSLQEGLGKGDKAPRIDHKNKRIKTPAGELPISPLFDRDWLAKRQKIVKPPAGQASGRFRKKIYNNVYAQALAQPVRRCNKTHLELPRFFMQDLEVVRGEEEKGGAWWVPGPLSFTGLNLRMDTRVGKKKREQGDTTSSYLLREEARRDEVNPGSEMIQESEQRHESEVPEAIENQQAIDQEASTRSDYFQGRPNRAPVAAFVLSNHKVITSLNPKHPIADDRLDFIRGQTKLAPNTSTLLLKHLRQHAVDALIARSVFGGENPQRWVVPCATWEGIKDVRVRGCVLWLPKSGLGEEHKPYSTYDLEGVQFGSKLGVYNLRWLLGEEEVERLRKGAEVFGRNEILVLTGMPEKFMMQLHLLLWRLEGYLAPLAKVEDGSGKLREDGLRRGMV